MRRKRKSPLFRAGFDGRLLARWGWPPNKLW